MTTQVVPIGLLTSYIKELLEADQLLGDVWVEGEVSNLHRAQSGHVYFTLKDSASMLKCALFRAEAVRQRYPLQPGDQVAAHGRVAVYERDGAYQLYVDMVQPAGLGLLALQLERLRQQLESEGFFDVARKRPLPAAPRVIGVVTSADGAVWHDIQHVLRRRYPLAEVVLSPAAVQGEHAPDAIVAALQTLQLDGRAEVIILARGGGSVEDLWAFNDERVARAVFACRVPVVSGVGHETDWTIVDGVADLRAPTPSAAAERCVPSVEEIQERLFQIQTRLHRLSAEEVRRRSLELQRLGDRLNRCTPRQQLSVYRHELTVLAGSAERTLTSGISASRSDLTAKLDVLHALNPGAVLSRGYGALSSGPSQTPIWQAAQLAPAQQIQIQLADGEVQARVDLVSRAGPALYQERVSER